MGAMNDYPSTCVRNKIVAQNSAYSPSFDFHTLSMLNHLKVNTIRCHTLFGSMPTLSQFYTWFALGWSVEVFRDGSLRSLVSNTLILYIFLATFNFLILSGTRILLVR